MINHSYLSSFMRSVDLHFSVEAIVEKEVVGHPHSVRLHGMSLAIVVVANVTIIVVTHFRLVVGLHFSLLSGNKVPDQERVFDAWVPDLDPLYC